VQSTGSENLPAFDVAKAPAGKESAEGAWENEIKGRAHNIAAAESAMENAGAASEKQQAGKGFEKEGRAVERLSTLVLMNS
jgi:hypothetical protein